MLPLLCVYSLSDRNKTCGTGLSRPLSSKCSTPRLQVELKQLLMPLSFAAVLGGTNTIIGTSTNRERSPFLWRFTWSTRAAHLPVPLCSAEYSSARKTR